MRALETLPGLALLVVIAAIGSRIGAITPVPGLVASLVTLSAVVLGAVAVLF
jgi:hypothetical protein